MKKNWALLLLLLFAFSSCPTSALAHGVDVTYQTKSAIEIEAKFDTGQPVSEGQVTIYAPNDPAKPWATGRADTNGRYVFTPDSTITGIWDVQVRQAGHGGTTHITVGEDGAANAAGSTGGYSTMQIILMSACVIWGFVGTALYFSRRNS